MNTMERFHTYIQTKNNNQINDRITITRNVIFDTINIQSDDIRHDVRAKHLLARMQSSY